MAPQDEIVGVPCSQCQFSVTCDTPEKNKMEGPNIGQTDNKGRFSYVAKPGQVCMLQPVSERYRLRHGFGEKLEPGQNVEVIFETK